MKYSKNHAKSIAAVALFVLVAGCAQKSPTALSSLSKSSMVIMKASTGTNTKLDGISVVGGSLDIQTSMINIGKFRIEENSGLDVEQQGGDTTDMNDELQSEYNDADTINTVNEQDAQDIIVTGPFSLDVSSGEAFIDSVMVYPGTFRKVDITFTTNATPPFDGKSIVISGEFTPTGGTAIPFTLKSEFSKEIQTQIAGNGITVNSNSTVPVVVTFDLAGWFSNLDFANAQITNGEILILIDNTTHNANLLSAFEANLAQFVEVNNETEEGYISSH